MPDPNELLEPPRTTAAQITQQQRLRRPGMIPEEQLIFDTWWQLHQHEYQSSEFNVRVGTGFDPGPEHPQFIRDNAVKNTQKRIDALLSRDGRPEIVEVKRRAEPWVIGQIMAYNLLFQRDNPQLPVPTMRVLTAQTDPDTVFVCARLGIALDLVPTDFSAISTKGK